MTDTTDAPFEPQPMSRRVPVQVGKLDRWRRVFFAGVLSTLGDPMLEAVIVDSRSGVSPTPVRCAGGDQGWRLNEPGLQQAGLTVMKEAASGIEFPVPWNSSRWLEGVRDTLIRAGDQPVVQCWGWTSTGEIKDVMLCNWPAEDRRGDDLLMSATHWASTSHKPVYMPRARVGERRSLLDLFRHEVDTMDGAKRGVWWPQAAMAGASDDQIAAAVGLPLCGPYPRRLQAGSEGDPVAGGIGEI